MWRALRKQLYPELGGIESDQLCFSLCQVGVESKYNQLNSIFKPKGKNTCHSRSDDGRNDLALRYL